MGAFPLFASGPAGAKAHAPLNGGVCVCGGKERLAACLWQGAVCLLRAGILPNKAAAPSAAAKGNRQPLCRKPLFGRGGFRPCHGRNAPAPFMCAHWLLKRVLRCGNVLLWQECPSARPRPRRPALFMCVRTGWPKRALRCGNVLLWQECPSARPRPRRPALFMCVRTGWPKRALRCGNVLLWQECPSARPQPKQPTLAMHGPGAQASGRNNSAQAPPCGRFESTSLPPCSRAASSAMARPRPICPAAGLRAASPE